MFLCLQCTVQVKLELGHRAQLRKKVTSEGFTHDWMVFVRGPENSDIQHFVDKVVFRLHESFPKPKRGKFHKSDIAPQLTVQSSKTACESHMTCYTSWRAACFFFQYLRLGLDPYKFWLGTIPAPSISLLIQNQYFRQQISSLGWLVKWNYCQWIKHQPISLHAFQVSHVLD